LGAAAAPLLARVSSGNTNEVRGINRVVYDVSSKPLPNRRLEFEPPFFFVRMQSNLPKPRLPIASKLGLSGILYA